MAGCPRVLCFPVRDSSTRQAGGTGNTNCLTQGRGNNTPGRKQQKQRKKAQKEQVNGVPLNRLGGVVGDVCEPARGGGPLSRRARITVREQGTRRRGSEDAVVVVAAAPPTRGEEEKEASTTTRSAAGIRSCAGRARDHRCRAPTKAGDVAMCPAVARLRRTLGQRGIGAGEEGSSRRVARPGARARLLLEGEESYTRPPPRPCVFLSFITFAFRIGISLP